MNIQSNPVISSARPPRESWTLGEQAKVDFQGGPLTSTSDLLQLVGDLPEEGIPATYSFQRDCSRMEPAQAKDLAAGALVGAAAGALGCVGVAGLPLMVVFGFISALSASLPGGAGSVNPEAVMGLALGAPAVLGAAVGGILGSESERQTHQDYQKQGEAISGTLQRDRNSNLVFHPGNQADESVNLPQFAQQPIISGGEAGSSQEGQWWQKAAHYRQNQEVI